jgi:hypothetical protein
LVNKALIINQVFGFWLFLFEKYLKTKKKSKRNQKEVQKLFKTNSKNLCTYKTPRPGGPVLGLSSITGGEEQEYRALV